MKALLVQYLKGDVEMIYPRIETRVVSISPLRLTDDYRSHIELAGSQLIMIDVKPEIVDDLNRYRQSDNLKLQLNEWRFDMRSTLRGEPKPHIVINKYKIVSVGKVMVPTPQDTLDMIEDEVVK